MMGAIAGDMIGSAYEAFSRETKGLLVYLAFHKPTRNISIDGGKSAGFRLSPE